jgi:hypothetical protein|tara:strand:+ start:92 stop:310 length:219 start_codon:yes stop_codon:yes gene_type:complete
MSEENNVEDTSLAGIGIADIVLACNIIDLATQRGAFKAAEAAQVGACFEKLVAFVKANTPDEETPAETAAEV